MLYTPLHRLLGEAPGPLTDAMLEAAIEQRIAESEELDWKQKLPEQREFKNSDHVKDIAAFANAGGGILVFGVDEDEKVPTGRVDAGECLENYERTIQQVCTNAIMPPIFGVRVHRIGEKPQRAVALVVPASMDGPHLIYKGDQFKAPLRVNADTHWMTERDLAAAYRARFEAARHAQDELENLYDDMAQSFDTAEHAVFVGAVRPRVTAPVSERRDMASAALIVDSAAKLADWWLADPSGGYHPLSDVSPYSSRAGLRGWVAPPTNENGWRPGRAAVFDNGSVSLAWRAGGHRGGVSGDNHLPWEVSARALEGFVAGLLALAYTTAEAHPSGDLEVRVGVEWTPLAGEEQLQRLKFIRDGQMRFDVSEPLAAGFRPITVTVDPSASPQIFIRAVVDFATDCINQVGFREPERLFTNLPPRDHRYA